MGQLRSLEGFPEFLHQFGNVYAGCLAKGPLLQLPSLLIDIARPEVLVSPSYSSRQVMGIAQHSSCGLQKQLARNPHVLLTKPTGIQTEARREHCRHATEALASKTQLISKASSSSGLNFPREVRRQCIHQKCLGLIGTSSVARVRRGIVDALLTKR